ncbi:hypothetical protein Tco_0801817 [Tanacetum coccineum]|uniref:Reverse transcriptase Ty1/copia-type domain-containing protein n=1 Tax=Tanacetum coccineum TaxID=301880 RepID=A0ABQ4ZX13_9ASTR
MNSSPIPTNRIHKGSPKDQIIRDINSVSKQGRMNRFLKNLYGQLHQKVEENKSQRLSNRTQEGLEKRKALSVYIKLLEPGMRPYYLLFRKHGFKRGIIDKTLFIKKDKGDILFVQEVPDEFYKGAHFLLRVASHVESTPIETNKALLKDEEAEDVDVHLYRSMIGSLMYLTASRPDIMFAVCACARKSTQGVVNLLAKVDFMQCKKQTVVANSTIESKYVAAANCCGQVLWIQNQMLDYCFNFMNTKIYTDNENEMSIGVRGRLKWKGATLLQLRTDSVLWLPQIGRCAMIVAASITCDATAGLVNSVRLNLMLLSLKFRLACLEA